MRRSAIEVTISLPLDIEQGKHGLFFITSPLIRGLLVATESVESGLLAVPDVLDELVKAMAEARR